MDALVDAVTYVTDSPKIYCGRPTRLDDAPLRNRFLPENYLSEADAFVVALKANAALNPPISEEEKRSKRLEKNR